MWYIYNAIGDNGFYLSKQKVWEDEIFSAEDLESYKLNCENPTCSALYYYTLRNNVVHSSKAMPQEIDTVWNALLGLKEIFSDVLKEVENE